MIIQPGERFSPEWNSLLLTVNDVSATHAVVSYIMSVDGHYRSKASPIPVSASFEREEEPSFSRLSANDN